MTLEYLREYRTYFHIGQSWGLNESTAYRIITKIENILIKSPTFRLPGKKQLLKSTTDISVVIIDVTENQARTSQKKQKKENRDLASIRIVIEHVYRSLKIFRILSERYRNRRKRFSLRFNLIAAIYNYELCLSSN